MSTGGAHLGVLSLSMAALALALGGCQTPPPPAEPAPIAVAPPSPPPVEPPAPSRYSAVGKASWYGTFHHGRKTASGEPFDKEALTAAHRSLPLDTRVRVTNLENGRSVEVVVNDRGPYVRGRLIDLSEAAARRLGFRSDGLTRVRVEELPTPAIGGSAAGDSQPR